jgi:hypothetical protein
MFAFIRKLFSEKVVAVPPCGFCKQNARPVFKPTLYFWPDRRAFPHARPVTVTVGTPACEKCRGKIAWHNIAGNVTCELVEKSFQKVSNLCHANFKETVLEWHPWQ